MSEPKRIAIVGCGGVGTWAAITVAHAAKGQEGLVAALGLFDSDVVEARNLARVPLASMLHGVAKTRSVKLFIREHVKHDCPIDTGPAITADNIDIALGPYDTIICATDSIESQRLVKVWCDHNNKTYQRAGYDGDTINVCRQMGLTFDAEAERADAGYHGEPEVYHAMLAGCLAAYSVLRSPITIMGEVAKLVVAGASFVPETLLTAVVGDRWEEMAQDHDWHHEDNCTIPNDYHHIDDCNHDDCCTYDSAVETYFDNTNEGDVLERVGHECDHSDCIDVDTIVGENPAEATRALKYIHRDKHTETCPRWCPWRATTAAAA